MAAPDVFIIESLRFEDESGDRLEGKTLSNILRLAGKNPACYYIRTKLELSKILHIFDNSDYRYLHFSFHGGSDGLDLTLETLTNRELYNIISPHIDKKRIFFSSCEYPSAELASHVFKNTDAYSLAGPTGKIRFDKSAAMWAAFYVAMFSKDPNKMQHSVLFKTLRKLSGLFDEELSYYRRNTKKPHFRKHSITPVD